MSLEPETRPLLGRIRSVRGSLRGPSRPAAIETPVEEYERLRREQNVAKQDLIRLCGFGWLAAQVMAFLTCAFGFGWRESWPAWLPLAAGVFWLGSMAFAFAALAGALKERDVLPRRWFVASFIPWGVLVLEATLLMPMLT